MSDAITIAPAPYVTVPLAALMTGFTAKAIERKIQEGVWLEGREFRRAPDGRILISIKGFQSWVEQGVEVRPNSVRVTFTYEGRQQRRTLILNGKPLEPSPANLKYAERLAAEIREKVRLGSFSMVEYFPAAGDSGEAMTVGTQLDRWKAAQRLEASTLAGYESARQKRSDCVGGRCTSCVDD